jgi:hypothetical protein
MIAKGNGVLVLAKVIARKPAAPGYRGEFGKPDRQPIEFVTLVLQRVDAYYGDVPVQFEAAISKGDVDRADRVLKSQEVGSHALDGVQVGDVSIWPLIRVESNGLFHDNFNGSAEQSMIQGRRIVSAPGHVFLMPPHSSYEAKLMTGQFPNQDGKKIGLPPIDEKLSPPLRYADMIIRSAAAQRAKGLNKYAGWTWLRMLAALHGELSVPFASDLPAVVDLKDAGKWLVDQLDSRLPSASEEDRLNYLGIRLTWGDADALEPEFINLYRRLGRSGLLVLMPPVKDARFHIESCEGTYVDDAVTGFYQLRSNRVGGARVAKAALRWLEVVLSPEDSRERWQARARGMAQAIVQYVVDVAPAPELLGDAQAPSTATLERAKEILQKMIGP